MAYLGRYCKIDVGAAAAALVERKLATAKRDIPLPLKRCRLRPGRR